jgi:sugar O-acyltransferase (sialic acid O-acetyltransferase NeuD family)
VSSVVILGCGGHALVVWDILQCVGQRVLGFTAPDVAPGTPIRLGDVSRPVLGDDDALPRLLSEDADVRLVAGVGPEPPAVRRAIVERIRAFGAGRTLVACHPRSVVALSVRLGDGTAVMAGAVVNPNVVVGTHCVVNTGSTIDHECLIADNVFIGPGAHLSGRVTVDEGAVIGVGASVRENIRIGRYAFVGGGAFVSHDVPDGMVVGGVPARVLRPRARVPA